MFDRFKTKIVKFYTHENELEVTLFKMLGTAGVMVSLIGCLQALLTQSGYMGALLNLIMAGACLCLIWFVHATKKYIVGYLISSVTILMGLFTWMFF